MKRLLIVLVFVSMAFLSACGNKYNIVEYDDVTDWIDETFAEQNRTYGAFYEYGEMNDEKCPSSRTFIINNQEDFENVFSIGTKELEVDFENEMLLIYTFTTPYHRDISIENVEFNEDTLMIEYKMKRPIGAVGDAARPFQRYLLVRMDKLEITTVIFEES